MRDPTLAPLLGALDADEDAVALIEFGSAARGEPARDRDLAVVLHRRATPRASAKDLHYKEHASGIRHEGLDVSAFQALPIYVRQRVLAEGRILWTKDERELYAVALQTVRDWEAFRPRYEMYLEAVARG